MKDVLSNANFPQDAQGRTYHVATCAGQVANRIITVGDQVRAHRIAKSFDGGAPLFTFNSQRNFLTLTGTFHGVPISIVAIGMGFSVVDFFVRECRAVVEGEMIIVRLGSCGSMQPEYGIGTVVVPKASFGIMRNYDYFHHDTSADERRAGALEPYIITKPLDADAEVHDALLAALEADKPAVKANLFEGGEAKAVGNTVNASADSFYGSQGRIDPAFVDANANLIDVIRERRPGVATLEMETFVLNHLAAAANDAIELAEKNGQTPVHKGKIRTGAIQMIFANRNTSAFISPEECETLEHWAGKSVLDALASIEIPKERLHPHGVWDTAASS
ncbi:Nucleoside phosphorylase domain protein [Kalmanozyma brasiliensis GHG001]|uniref:Amino acid transporter protein n=1 Tax=Kalmanozyma brasiliensis (strain GHG001) TaxID=1365824 RepID=V5GUG2_KALBG|nr:Nucleoside phosphorylase domain protein [Kalmanozyma brasiliensis GHG001]EST09522.1 Nucleoside phosphorylase domain protein [Kalmanozyma brasiliensis GHG001]